MNDSELPEAAIKAAFEALLPSFLPNDASVVARAVLVAATERIVCFSCAHNDEPGTQWDWHTATWIRCSRCAGTGRLFVLKETVE